MVQLHNLGFLPDYVEGIAQLVLQSYKGHVTIAPKPRLIDYMRLVTNVTREEFDYVI